VTAPPPVSRAGNIYDLGYRRYEGARLGRAHAVRSLVFHSFRTTFGIGRSGRAKAAPITFGAIATLPAVIIVGGLTIAARFGFDRQLEPFDDAAGAHREDLHGAAARADLQSEHVPDRRIPADGRHDPVVLVAERFERLSGNGAQDVLPRAGPLLHRDLRHAGQRLAVFHEHADVAGDEDVGMRRKGERRFRRDASRAIERHPERLRDR